MMLVSFIPDAICPGSRPVIWSTSVGVVIIEKTSQLPDTPCTENINIQ